MRVLVADKFEQSGLDGLKALGCDVVYEADLEGDRLRARLGETQAEILIVRSTKVPAEVIEGSSLSLIIRAGAGYNTIDVAAASANGVYVANCPGKNSHAVAELAFGLMLAIDRHIADNVAELRGGRWNKKRFSKARGMWGRTLGLVGLGQIGQDMIPRARAFGMNVVGYSRWMTPEVASALGIGMATSLEEIAAQSDFVSVHVSLRPETRGMLGASFFDALPAGAVFVNTSRAEVVDQSALVAAVKAGRVRAGLDVFEGEPTGGEAAYEGELRELDGVYCTHHIGASTDEAQEAVAAETVRIVREYMHTGLVPNVVNIGKGETATHLLVIRHLDRVGVLAHVLGVLKEEEVSIQEMENIVLGGAKAAIAQISMDKGLTDGGLGRIRTYADVMSASVFPIQRGAAV